MQDPTSTTVQVSHPRDNVAKPTPAGADLAKLVVSEYDPAFRASFDRPLNSIREGASVTVTVTVTSMRGVAGGRASGVVTGPGGSAIVAVPRETLVLHGDVLTPDSTITVRGFVDIVGRIPTIRILSAQAVNV